MVRPRVGGDDEMAASVNGKLQQAVTGLADERAELLAALVRCPSLLGREGGAQRLMAERLADLGLDVDVWEPDVEQVRRHPAFCAYPGFDELGYCGRPMVVGRLAGAGGGRSLILQGHMDVVSAEPRAAWSHDPWGGERVDGRIYGRGSADMKGGLVAAVSAVEAFVVSGIRPRGDVLIQSVIDEEAYSNGALACALRGYRADAAIVGEPTGLEVIAAHAGVSHFRITVEGRSAHPSHKTDGVCAIEKSMLVYRALMELEADRRARVSHPLFPNGSPVEIVVGTMRAGTWRSSVAGEAVLETRLGFAPGETIEQVEAELVERLGVVSDADPWLRNHPLGLERIGYTASADLPVEHPFIGVVREVARAGGRGEIEIQGHGAGCDMQSLIHHAETPAIVWGPGASEAAHVADEFVELADVERAARLYAETIAAWCGLAT